MYLKLRPNTVRYSTVILTSMATRQDQWLGNCVSIGTEIYSSFDTSIRSEGKDIPNQSIQKRDFLVKAKWFLISLGSKFELMECI